MVQIVAQLPNIAEQSLRDGGAHSPFQYSNARSPGHWIALVHSLFDMPLALAALARRPALTVVALARLAAASKRRRGTYFGYCRPKHIRLVRWVCKYCQYYCQYLEGQWSILQ